MFPHYVRHKQLVYNTILHTYLAYHLQMVEGRKEGRTGLEGKAKTTSAASVKRQIKKGCNWGILYDSITLQLCTTQQQTTNNPQFVIESPSVLHTL